MPTIFSDRHAAGLELARKLQRYHGTRPIVLAIPRGGMLVAEAVAERLDGDLDTVFVRKLGAPFNEEFAIGSVDEDGNVHLRGGMPSSSAALAYIEREKARQLEIMRNERRIYTPDRPAADIQGRNTIIVDDGLATGATMIAALKSARRKNPARLIVAVPVAALESLAEVGAHADHVVFIQAPRQFFAVSKFYLEFPQVSDAAVIAALQAARARHLRLH